MNPTPTLRGDVSLSRDGDDAIVLDLQTNDYFELNHTGLCIWESLSAGRTLSEAAEDLATAFEIPQNDAREAVDALVAALGKAGLLEGSQKRGTHLTRLMQKLRR